MSPKDLIKTLYTSFRKFDQVIEKFNLEKLKTIGDSYMCAGGLPVKNNTHPIDACLAALELKIFMKEIKNLKDSLGFEFWDQRIGIHSGPVIAGGEFRAARSRCHRAPLHARWRQRGWR